MAEEKINSPEEAIGGITEQEEVYKPLTDNDEEPKSKVAEDLPITIDPRENRPRSFTDLEVKGMDAYRKAVSDINAREQKKRAGETLEHLEEAGVWYDAAMGSEALSPQRNDYGFWNALDDMTKSDPTLSTTRHLLEVAASGVLNTIGYAGSGVDILDWRLAEFLPTYQDLVGTTRNVNLMASEYLYAGAKGLTEELLTPEQTFAKAREMGIELSMSEVQAIRNEHKRRQEKYGPEAFDERQRLKALYNETTDKIVDAGKNSVLHKYVLAPADYVLAQADKAVGDEYNTSNIVTDAAMKANSNMMSANGIQSEFTFENDVSLWSWEGLKYTAGGLKEGLPTVFASIAIGKGTQLGITKLRPKKGPKQKDNLYKKETTKEVTKKKYGTPQERYAGFRELEDAAKQIDYKAKFGPSVSQAYRDMLKASKIVVKADDMTKLGMSVISSRGETAQIMHDVENRALVINADLYGGEEWKEYQDAIVGEAMRRADIHKLNDRQIQEEVEMAKRAAVHSYFDTPEKRGTYLKILRNTEQAARIAGKVNSGMIWTNLVDAHFIFRLGNKKAALTGITRGGIVEAPSYLKAMDNVIVGSATEGFVEEGGFNVWSEWAGIAFAEGRNLYGDEFAERTMELESADDIYIGAMMGGGMASISDASTYNTRKEAYDRAEQGIREVMATLPEDVASDMESAMLVNKSVMENTKIAKAMRRAIENGESDDELYWKQIHNSALTAFRVGQTDMLLEIYKSVETNNKDPKTRQLATEIINEIESLEKDYTVAQQYEDSYRVMQNLSNQRITQKTIGTNEQFVPEVRDALEERLDRMGKNYDAEYSYDKDGFLKFTGKDAQAFKDEALSKDKPISQVSNYNAVMNSRKVLSGIQEKLDTAFDGLTSEQHEQATRNQKRAYNEVRSNYRHIMSAENKKDFNRRVYKILNKMDLTSSQKKGILNRISKDYNKVSIMMQKRGTAKKKIGVTPDKLYSKKIRQLANEFNSEMEEKGNFAPKRMKNVSKEAKEEAKSVVSSHKQTNPEDTFSDMVDDFLGQKAELEEDKLTGQAYEDRKEAVREIYNMLVAGWELNKKSGDPEIDYDQKFDEIFGEEYTPETGIKRLMKFVTPKKDERQEKKVQEKKEDRKKEEDEGIAEVEAEPELKPTASNKTQQESLEDEEEADKHRVYELSLNPRAWFIAVKPIADQVVDAAGKIIKHAKYTLVTDSVIRSLRLANPNRFNRGDQVGLKIDDNAENVQVNIVRRENGKFKKIADKNFKMGAKGLHEFFAEKFQRRRGLKVRSTTEVIPTKNGFRFREEHANGKKYSHKTYVHLTGKSKNNKPEIEHKVTDDFVVIEEDQFSMLNEPDVTETHLVEVVNIPSSEETDNNFSHIVVEIVREGQKKPVTEKVRIENDYEQNQPLAVTDPQDGATIAWIETPSMLQKSNTEDVGVLRDAQLTLAEFRKNIINGKKPTTSISEKKPEGKNAGYAQTDGVWTKLSDTDPDIIMGVTANGKIKYGGTAFENKSRRIVNASDARKNKDGVVYEVRKIGTEKNGKVKKGKEGTRTLYMAFPVKGLQEKQDEVSKNSIVWALKAYLTQHDEDGDLGDIIGETARKQVIETIDSLGGPESVTTPTGIRDYLMNFMLTKVSDDVLKEEKKENRDGEEVVYKTMDRKLFLKHIKGFEIKQEDGIKPILMIRGNKVFFALRDHKGIVPIKDGGTTMDMIELETSEYGFDENLTRILIDNIETHAGNFGRTHNTKTYAEDRMIANFDEYGNGTEISYRKHQKDTYYSNIVAFPVEEEGADTFHISLTNTMVTFETGDTRVTKKKKKKREAYTIGTYGETKETSDVLPERETVEESAGKDLTDKEMRLLQQAKDKLKLLGAENVDFVSDLMGLDEDIVDEAEDLPFKMTKGQRRQLEAELRDIPDVNPKQKLQIVMAVVNHIMAKHDEITPSIIKHELKNAYNEVLNSRKEGFELFLKKLKLQGKGIEGVDSVIEEFEKNLKKFDIIKANWSSVESAVMTKMVKYLDLSKAAIENAEDIKEEEQDPERIFEKESIEWEGKQSLSKELKKFMAGILIRESDNSAEIKSGFLGVPIYIPFDKTVNIATAIIGSNLEPNMTFDDMVEKLVEFGEDVPFIPELVKKLKDPEQTPKDMQNKFMTHMIKHNMSMKYMMYEYDAEKGGFSLKVWDTNSSEIEKVIEQEWKNALYIPVEEGLITRNEDGEAVISKEKSSLLLEEFNELKKISRKSKKHILNNRKRFIDWLGEFGISMSDAAMVEFIRDGLTTYKGEEITFDGSFVVSEKTNGIFGGIAQKLTEYGRRKQTNLSKNPELVPTFNVDVTFKALAKLESKHTTRTVTISFMDGGKTYAGFVPPKFATDRLLELKEESDTRDDLEANAFSSGSMLLEMLTTTGEDVEDLVYDDVVEMLYVDHLGGAAMKVKGDNPNTDRNAITKLSTADQEITRQGFFGDIQSTVASPYRGIKLRMARMFFPTMSDKKQMMAMNMPVLDLNHKLISKIGKGEYKVDAKVKQVLIEQLLLPELKRMVEFHKNDSKKNITGYNLGAQLFWMIPEMNNIKLQRENADGDIVPVRLPKVIANEAESLASDSKAFKDLINEIGEAAYQAIEKVLVEETRQKVDKWKKTGIIKPLTGQNESLNVHYFENRKGNKRFLDNETELAALDFVINNLISQSNMYQLIADDIAFYTGTKIFKNVGVDRAVVEVVDELRDLETYGEVMDKLDSMIADENISDARRKELQDIKSQIEPVPYESSDDSVYIEMAEDVGTNLGKRLALLLAPGTKTHGWDDIDYIQVFLKDDVSEASNMEFLVDLNYGEKGVERYKQIMAKNTSRDGKYKLIRKEFPIIQEFFNIESTDAQEYTTGKEHLDILLSQGKITEEVHEIALAKIIDQTKNGVTEDNKLSHEELKFVFQPMKPVYAGSAYDQKSGLMRMVYVKSSSYPLIPQNTKGLKLDELRVALENLQSSEGMNVRAAYKTGVKVGASATEVTVFGDMSVDALKESSTVLPRTNFKIQQEVPAKAFTHTEDKVTMGTQLMKLLFGDGVLEIEEFNFDGEPKSGKELHKKYNRTYGEIVTLAKNELYDELGLAPDGEPYDEQIYVENLSRILKKEAVERNYPQQDIDALEVIPVYKNGKVDRYTFAGSIWLSTNSVRHEALLNSLITKRMIKLKLPGYSYVAGSELGYEVDNTIKRDDIDQSQIIYTKHWDDTTGRITPATKTKKAQVFVPSRFRNNKGELINLFEGKGDNRKYISKVDGKWKLKDDMIADELLSITSFRIPTSSHVSASEVDIAGFLPESSGDLMIVPKEFAVQKGLDYDIDKESSYFFWTHTKKDGTVVKANKQRSLESINGELKDMEKLLDEMRINESHFLNVIDKVENEPEFTQKEHSDRIMHEILESVIYSDDEVSIPIVYRRIKALRKIKRKLLDNDIIDINKAVMSSTNADVQEKINKALSMEFAKSMAETLQSRKEGFTTVLSDEFQTEKMNLGAMGQMGIGVYSNFVVTNSLLQQLEDPAYFMDENGDDITITIGGYTSAGMLGRYTNILSKDDLRTMVERVSKMKISKAERERLVNKLENGRLNMSKLREIAGDNAKALDVLTRVRTISEAFAERQNTATDNANEEIMGRVGVTAGTINVDSMLTMLGFDKGDMITDINGEQKESSLAYLLISQPIVKEYIQMKDHRDSNINEKKKKNVDIIRELVEKYSDERVSADKSGKITYKKGHKPKKAEDLTAQTLYDNIKKGETGDVQVAALEIYKKIEEYGMEFSVVQNLLSITKNGLDKSLFNVTYLYDGISKIAFNNKFSNVTDLFGEFVSKIGMTPEQEKSFEEQGYLHFGDAMFKPETMMGHMLAQSVSTAYQQWMKLFPHANESFNATVNEITDIIGSQTYGKNEEIELKNTVMRETIKYMNSSMHTGVIFDDPYKERERLFMDQDDSPSLASYLLDLKKKHNEVFVQNDFLSDMLQYEIGTGDEISRVKYDNTASNDFEEDYVYHSFSELITDIKPLPDNKSVNLDHLDDFSPLGSFAFSLNEKQRIKDFRKTVVVSASDKKMVKGEERVMYVDDERFIVRYEGEITLKQYDGNFTIDNGIENSSRSKIEKQFAKGEKKHIFKILPVYDTAMLADDLVSYAMLSGGTHSSVDISKYIPLKLLEIVGFTKTMNKYDVTDPTLFYGIHGYGGEISAFTIQFFQNNPERLQRIPPKKLGIAPGTLKKYKTGILPEEKVPLTTRPDGTSYRPAMFSSYEKKAGLVVFLHVDDGYVTIPVTGVHGMAEYDISKSNVNSILDPIKKAPYFSTGGETTNIQDIYKINTEDINLVLRNISTRGDDIGRLAKELLDTNVEGLTVEVKDLGGIEGRYDEERNVIYIDEKVVKSGNGVLQAELILHEYVHALTVWELDQYFSPSGKLLVSPESLPTHIKNLIDVFELTKKEFSDKFDITEETMAKVREAKRRRRALNEKENIAYGLLNIKEFASMAMSDEDFRDALSTVKVKDKTLLEKFADAIVELIRKINPNIEGSLLEVTNSAIMNTISVAQAPALYEDEITREQAIDILESKMHTMVRSVEVRGYQMSGNVRYIDFRYEGNNNYEFRLENVNGKYSIYSKKIKEKEFLPSHKYSEEQENRFVEKYGNIANFINSKFGPKAQEAFTAGFQSIPDTAYKDTAMTAGDEEQSENKDALITGDVLTIVVQEGVSKKNPYYIMFKDRKGNLVGTVPYENVDMISLITKANKVGKKVTAVVNKISDTGFDFTIVVKDSAQTAPPKKQKQKKGGEISPSRVLPPPSDLSGLDLNEAPKIDRNFEKQMKPLYESLNKIINENIEGVDDTNIIC